MTRQTIKHIGQFIFGLVALYAAYSMLMWANAESELANISKHWPAYSGKIIESTIHDEGQKFGASPVVRYQYVVDSIEYEGSRIAFGSTNMSHEAASEVRGKYRVGNAVAVFANPSQPSLSVLEVSSEETPGVMSAMFAGVSTLIIGLVFIIQPFLSKRKAD